jgi:hypothetical protein
VGSSIDDGLLDGGAGNGATAASRPVAWVVGVVLFAVGAFLTTRSFPKDVWSEEGLSRFLRFSALYWAAAVPLLLLRPALFGALLFCSAVVVAGLAVGPWACLAAAFVLMSAEALGAILLRHEDEPAPEQQALNALLGIAVYVTVLAVAVRVRVNFSWTYALVLAAPVVFDAHRLGRKALAWARSSGKLASGSHRIGLGLLTYVLAVHLFIALRPEASADGLAMHLAIPADVALHHRLTFDPGRHVWAVMPMGADYAHTMAYLLGGQAASRLLNFGMLCAIVVLLYCAVRRWVAPAMAFLLAACFAATPLVALVTGSLFVENQQAALLLGSLVALWRFAETSARKYLYLGAIFGGTALATKLTSLWFVVCVLPFAVWVIGRKFARSSAPNALAAVAAVGLLLSFAAPPYVIAFWKTGNPFFPFHNDTFRSPIFELAKSQDPDFVQGLSFGAPLGFASKSSAWQDVLNGSLGLHYPLLLPLAVVAFAAFRRVRIASAAFVSIVGGLFLLHAAPGARDVYPALPLLFIPAAALLASLLNRPGAISQLFVVSLAACTALNLYFFPLGSPYDRDFEVPFSGEARRDYIRRAAALRRVTPPADHAPFLDPADVKDGTVTEGKRGLGTISISPGRVPICRKTGHGRTRVSWTVSRVPVEIRVGAPDGGTFVSANTSGSADTGNWVAEGTKFYLQDGTASVPRTAKHTIAQVIVTETVDGPCP